MISIVYVYSERGRGGGGVLSNEKPTVHPTSWVCEVLWHSTGVWFSFNEMEVNKELASLYRVVKKQKQKNKTTLMLIFLLKKSC